MSAGDCSSSLHCTASLGPLLYLWSVSRPRWKWHKCRFPQRTFGFWVIREVSWHVTPKKPKAPSTLGPAVQDDGWWVVCFFLCSFSFFPSGLVCLSLLVLFFSNSHVHFSGSLLQLSVVFHLCYLIHLQEFNTRNKETLKISNLLLMVKVWQATKYCTIYNHIGLHLWKNHFYWPQSSRLACMYKECDTGRS